MKEKIKEGFCFRCEHRARFLEMGDRPRSECGDIDQCKYGCYMYLPVKPVLLEKVKGDKRPQFAGAMISARSHFSKVANEEVHLELKKYKEGNMIYWTPDVKKKKRSKK